MHGVGERAAALVKALAVVLRERREALGLSKNEVAARSGLSHPFIGFIEKGTRCPTVDSLARIAESLETDLSGLIREAEEKVER